MQDSAPARRSNASEDARGSARAGRVVVAASATPHSATVQAPTSGLGRGILRAGAAHLRLAPRLRCAAAADVRRNARGAGARYASSSSTTPSRRSRAQTRRSRTLRNAASRIRARSSRSPVSTTSRALRRGRDDDSVDQRRAADGGDGLTRKLRQAQRQRLDDDRIQHARCGTALTPPPFADHARGRRDPRPALERVRHEGEHAAIPPLDRDERARVERDHRRRDRSSRAAAAASVFVSGG